MPKNSLKNSLWNYLWFGTLTPGFCNLCEATSFRVYITIPFVLQFSKTLATCFLIHSFACWILSGVWYRKAATFLREPAFLLLFVPFNVLLVAGLFYTSAPWDVALGKWGSAYHLLILPIGLALFTDKSRKAAFWSMFNLAMLSVFLLYFLASLLPLDQSKAVRNLIQHDYITTGLFAVWWCAGWICFPFASRFLIPVHALLPASIISAMSYAAGDRSRGYESSEPSEPGNPDESVKSGPNFLECVFVGIRWAILSLGLIYVFGICPSRTAHACFIAILFGLLIYRFRIKGFLYALVCVSLLLPSIWFASPLVRKRIARFTEEWKTFDVQAKHEPLKKMTRANSTQSRILFYVYGWKAFRERPVFGWGTGGIATAYEHACGEKGIGYAHSEYTAVALQWGLLGLSSLLVWLFVLARRAWQLPQPWGALAWCNGILLVLGMFMVDLLSFGVLRIMHVLLLAVILSPDASAIEPVPRRSHSDAPHPDAPLLS